MTSLRRNVLANFAGTGWATVVQLVCVPFYVRLMGVEAWALVGFHLTLQALLQVLDLGVTPTMNREMARYSAQPDRASEMRDFVRTLEAGSWTLGLVLGAAVWALAPFIAVHWVNAQNLSAERVTDAVRLMGGLVAVQWPTSLYQGGLQGLQRQVRFNALRGGAATLSGFGGVLMLWLVRADISTFFLWQTAVAVLHLGASTVVFWASLPPAPRSARFAPALLKPVLGFATGMGGITFFGMLLMQMDKVVLSKLLTLEAFGYYLLAATAVNGLYVAVRPVYSAFFPRLCELVARGDEAGVRDLYHQGSQLLALLVLPAASVLALFSVEVVAVWTGDATIVAQAAPIVTALVIGTAINGVMHMPYALQLAHGWTSIGVTITVSMVTLLLPLLLLTATRYGGLGAASVWALLNVAYLAVGLPWTHARLLRGEAGTWLLSDIGRPLAGALGVAAAVRFLFPHPASTVQAAGLVVVAAVGSAGAALLLAPASRALVLRRVRGRTREG